MYHYVCYIFYISIILISLPSSEKNQWNVLVSLLRVIFVDEKAFRTDVIEMNEDCHRDKAFAKKIGSKSWHGSIMTKVTSRLNTYLISHLPDSIPPLFPLIIQAKRGKIDSGFLRLANKINLSTTQDIRISHIQQKLVIGNCDFHREICQSFRSSIIE